MGQACGKSSGSNPVQRAWDNHFAAFGAQDLDKIMLDYSEQSIITVYDQNSRSKTVYSGMAGARECFEKFFPSLSDIKDLEAPVQIVKEARKHEPGSVFLAWRCPASGYMEATDTFIFDATGRIFRQNVVVNYIDPKADGSAAAKDDKEAPEGSGKVHDGWANHFKAFGEQNVEDILKDYIAESEITVVNSATGNISSFKGIDGARKCFEGLFKSLHNCSNLDAPIIHVEEATDTLPGEVFLVWNCPASDYHRATDTFIFNKDGKITSQNVVVHHTPPVIQSAWDNHFAAFGAQDVEKILLDYSDESVITVYEANTGTNTVYTGLEGVRNCFEGLFKSLFDISNLAAPQIVVKEASLFEPGSVFLVWNCLASGYSQATDTFLFDSDGKIYRQNVVVAYQDPRGDGSVEAKNDTEAASGSGAVHDGWANHFKAFGDQNVDDILKDYTEDSEITVFNNTDGEINTYKGLARVKECFEGLFKSLKDCSDLAAPIIHVEEAKEGKPGEVFLVWKCPASGYERATDTFMFNAAGKITRQNVVVNHVTAATI